MCEGGGSVVISLRWEGQGRRATCRLVGGQAGWLLGGPGVDPEPYT